MLNQDTMIKNFDNFFKLSREHLTGAEMAKDTMDSRNILGGLLRNVKNYASYANDLDCSITVPINICAEIKDGVVNEHTFWQGFKDLLDYPTYLSLLSYFMTLGKGQPKNPIIAGIYNLIRTKNLGMGQFLNTLANAPLHQMTFWDQNNQFHYVSPLKSGFMGGVSTLGSLIKSTKPHSLIEISIEHDVKEIHSYINLLDNPDVRLLIMMIQRGGLEWILSSNQENQCFSISGDWEIGLKDGEGFARPINKNHLNSDEEQCICAYLSDPKSILLLLARFNHYLKVRNEQLQLHDVRDISQLILRVGNKKAQRLVSFLQNNGESPNTLSHHLKQFKHFQTALSRSLTDFAGNTPNEYATEEEKQEALKDAEQYVHALLFKTVNEIADTLETGKTSDLSKIWLSYCYLAAKYSDFVVDNFHANFHPDGLDDITYSEYSYSLSQWDYSIVKNFKEDLERLPIIMENHLIAPSFFLLANPKIMLDDATAWYIMSEKFIGNEEVEIDDFMYSQWFFYQAMRENPTFQNWLREIVRTVFATRMNGYMSHYRDGISLMPFLPMLQQAWMDCLENGDNAPDVIRENWGDLLKNPFESEIEENDDSGGNDGFDD